MPRMKRNINQHGPHADSICDEIDCSSVVQVYTSSMNGEMWQIMATDLHTGTNLLGSIQFLSTLHCLCCGSTSKMSRILWSDWPVRWLWLYGDLHRCWSLTETSQLSELNLASIALPTTRNFAIVVVISLSGSTQKCLRSRSWSQPIYVVHRHCCIWLINLDGSARVFSLSHKLLSRMCNVAHIDPDTWPREFPRSLYVARSHNLRSASVKFIRSNYIRSIVRAAINQGQTFLLSWSLNSRSHWLILKGFLSIILLEHFSSTGRLSMIFSLHYTK